MHPMIGLVQLLLIGFGLYLVSLIVYTVWGLTHPRRQTYASAVHRNQPGDPSELDAPVAYEERTITGTQGDLSLWIIKGENPTGPRVVMSHGWGSGKIGALKRLAPTLKNASQVVIWDMPGHGDSDGTTHLGSTEHQDLACVLDSLEPDQPTVLFGWSMGSGVSLACARAFGKEHSIIAVICESSYITALTPARNVIRLRGVPYRLNLKPAILILGTLLGVGPTWRGFARDQIVKDIDLPILILHGDVDPVSPVADAKQIASAAPNAQLVIIKGGGHNNLWTDEIYRQHMCEAMDSFFDRLGERA